MAAPNWTLFAAVVAPLTLALLVLARASARLLADAERAGGDAPPPSATADDRAQRAHTPLPAGGTLLANLALTHGVLGAALLGLAWYTAVPTAALGIGTPSPDVFSVGLGLGVGLYLASEASTAVADRLGVGYDEHLRELLAPGRPVEWILLVFVVLPLVAGAEELLFRGVLVGALAAGFGLPAPALVVASSVLFGLGHTAQGWAGIVVTAALGLVLGAAFVWTGSLAVVVVAHYVVDVLEFVVREGVVG